VKHKMWHCVGKREQYLLWSTKCDIVLVRRNSNCCEAQNVTLCWYGGTVTVVRHKICHFVHECQLLIGINLISEWQKLRNISVLFEEHHSLMLEACCLIVPLSHSGCIAEFFFGSGDKTSWHTFLTSLSDTSIQDVSQLENITAGGDFLGLCDQKNSYKHVSDFGRLRSYDRLKLRREGKDYWQ